MAFLSLFFFWDSDSMSAQILKMANGDARLYVLATNGTTNRLFAFQADSSAPAVPLGLGFWQQPTDTTAVYRTISPGSSPSRLTRVRRRPRLRR